MCYFGDLPKKIQVYDTKNKRKQQYLDVNMWFYTQFDNIFDLKMVYWF